MGVNHLEKFVHRHNWHRICVEAGVSTQIRSSCGLNIWDVPAIIWHTAVVNGVKDKLCIVECFNFGACAGEAKISLNIGVRKLTQGNVVVFECSQTSNDIPRHHSIVACADGFYVEVGVLKQIYTILAI